MNIVEIIMKRLGSGDSISKIASHLGVNQEQAGKAVGATIPTLLAGLVGAGTKPEGASQLASLLSKEAPEELGDLDPHLTAGASMGASESNPLSPLLGQGGLRQLTGVLSKFTGVSESAIDKLFGMLTPVVLGVLGRQARGLDATALSSLLASQQTHIKSAIPPGLGTMLSSAIPGIGVLLGLGEDQVSSAARAAGSTAASTGRQAESASSPFKRLLIPLIVAALAIFLLPRLCRKAETTGADTPAGATAPATDSTRFVTEMTDVLGALDTMIPPA